MIMSKQRDMRNECWHCLHKHEVPGNAHIACVKPDPLMKGGEHGVRNGWFYYPFLFDPVWKERLCANYEERVSQAVSPAVSPETPTGA